MPIILVHRIVVQIVHATLLRFAYTARINKQSRTIVQTYYTVVPTFILYCSRSFSAVVFRTSCFSLVIGNCTVVFGCLHFTHLCFSLLAKPLQTISVGISHPQTLHEVTTQYLEIQISIVRSLRLFVRSHVPHLPYNIDWSKVFYMGTSYPFGLILCPLCVLYK